MKIAITTVLTLLLTSSLVAQEKKSYRIDHKDPKSVVNALFYAARTNELSILSGLCDPLKENDRDTRAICELATDKEDYNVFIEAFKYGKIAGKIEMLTRGGQEGAKVPVVFVHPVNGTEKETILLIKRQGKFYLAGM